MIYSTGKKRARCLFMAAICEVRGFWQKMLFAIFGCQVPIGCEERGFVCNEPLLCEGKCNIAHLPQPSGGRISCPCFFFSFFGNQFDFYLPTQLFDDLNAVKVNFDIYDSSLTEPCIYSSSLLFIPSLCFWLSSSGVLSLLYQQELLSCRDIRHSI